MFYLRKDLGGGARDLHPLPDLAQLFSFPCSFFLNIGWIKGCKCPCLGNSFLRVFSPLSRILCSLPVYLTVLSPCILQVLRRIPNLQRKLLFVAVGFGVLCMVYIVHQSSALGRAAGGKDGKTVVTMDKDSLFIKLLQPGSKQPGKTREIIFSFLFVGPPIFWTSGEFCPGFQSQSGSLACMLRRLRAGDSTDSPLVQHLLTSWWPVLQPSFWSTYTWGRWSVEGVLGPHKRLNTLLASYP